MCLPGMRFLAIDDEPELQAMVDYTFGVLETLGIENGCMHSEIKLEPRGPVLIEVNCRRAARRHLARPRRHLARPHAVDCSWPRTRGSTAGAPARAHAAT